MLVDAYPRLAPSERRDALNSLAARPRWARVLLAAVESGRLPRTDLTADLVRQLRNLKDPDLNAQIATGLGYGPRDDRRPRRLIAQYKAMLTPEPGKPEDRSQGRAVFAKVCQQCHTLFGVGGQVGPDLTGSNRADLDYILSNVLDPSALIGKDYLAHIDRPGRRPRAHRHYSRRGQGHDHPGHRQRDDHAAQERGRSQRGERAIDDARRPLEAAVRAGDPLAGLVPGQPGAGADAG